MYYEKCFNGYKKNIKKNFQTFFIVNGKQVTDKATITNHFNNFFTNIGPELANKIHSPINVSLT